MNIAAEKDLQVIIDNVDRGTGNEYKLTLQHRHPSEILTLGRLPIPKRVYFANE